MKKGRFSTVILILIFFAGLSLLLYPTVSDSWNSLHQSRAITEYAEQVAELDVHRYEQLWAEAESYNKSLLQKENRFHMSDEEKKEYQNLLDISGRGVIGYIEIPAIDCSLPIYHGTDEAVLQIAVGHIEGTSLPTGGETTHCVISGHRGLPSARLFTDLDKMKEGDVFSLHVLDRILTYETDQILTVEPDETEALAIEPGKDYCTLVTCTPYGINSHRLLVRGHRIATPVSEEDTEEVQIPPTDYTFFVMAAVMGMILLLAVLLIIWKKRQKRKQKAQEERRTDRHRRKTRR